MVTICPELTWCWISTEFSFPLAINIVLSHLLLSLWSSLLSFSSSFLICLSPKNSPSFRAHRSQSYILLNTTLASFSIFLLDSSTISMPTICMRFMTMPSFRWKEVVWWPLEVVICMCFFLGYVWCHLVILSYHSEIQHFVDFYPHSHFWCWN